MASTKKVNSKLETKSKSIVVSTGSANELNLERSIDLDPEDWYWATWRNLEPLKRPEPKPFDLQDCLARLRKVTNSWNWSRAEISPSLSRAEAHFWCCAMAEPTTIVMKEQNHIVCLKPKDIAEILSNQSFDGNLSLEQAKRSCPPHSSSYSNYHLSEIYPLVNFLTTQEFINFADNTGRQSLLIVIEGFRHCILPYLTQRQLDNLYSYFSSRLDITKWPAPGSSGEISADFHFATGLKFYDELLSLVESWNDDLFSSNMYSYHGEPQEIIFGLKDSTLVEKHFRRLGLYLNSTDRIRAWLAHTEYAALDLIRDSILNSWQKELTEQLLEIFALVKAPEAAPYMLELMLDSNAPQVARKWLQDNPAHAIAGLIPVAAERGRLADAAIEFLRSMKRKGYTDFIQTCLERESTEITDRVRSTVLDFEEKSYIPFDDRTTPKWLQESLAIPIASNSKITWHVDPVDLPPIVCGDYCLNDRQIEAVLNTLRQREISGKTHPLAIAIKTHADLPELDTFAWKLFERWRADGSPTQEYWALRTIGIFGGDVCALKLAPLIRIWPGISQHSRAVSGLLCLQSIGTDIALMQIHGIAQKVKFKGIKQRAQECMEAIAKERNMSREQLEDRIVPDCDLDENGTLMFDFGARQFQFVLSENLKPMVKDGEGKIKTDLPKPNAKDDKEKAENAIAQWKSLKKQVNEILKLQPARLVVQKNAEMGTGRRSEKKGADNVVQLF
jgi:hypothetical protein